VQEIIPFGLQTRITSKETRSLLYIKLYKLNGPTGRDYRDRVEIEQCTCTLNGFHL
jgi:hypothetical protein